MRMTGLMLALLFTTGVLQAAPAVEPVVTRLEGVDPASRQIVADGITDPDRVAAKRVFDAMMTMHKIDIAVIEQARRG